MEFKTEDFLIDRDTATEKRILNRFENLLNDQDMRDKYRLVHSNQTLDKIFLLGETFKVLDDPASTRREHAFAQIVYAIVSEWEVEGEVEGEPDTSK
jgi:guanylate kinase